jgi:hypothetical protein
VPSQALERATIWGTIRRVRWANRPLAHRHPLGQPKTAWIRGRQIRSFCRVSSLALDDRSEIAVYLNRDVTVSAFWDLERRHRHLPGPGQRLERIEPSFRRRHVPRQGEGADNARVFTAEDLSRAKNDEPPSNSQEHLGSEERTRETETQLPHSIKASLVSRRIVGGSPPTRN